MLAVMESIISSLKGSSAILAASGSSRSAVLGRGPMPGDGRRPQTATHFPHRSNSLGTPDALARAPGLRGSCSQASRPEGLTVLLVECVHPGVQDVAEDGVAVQVEPFGNGADALRPEGALRVKIGHTTSGWSGCAQWGGVQTCLESVLFGMCFVTSQQPGLGPSGKEGGGMLAGKNPRPRPSSTNSPLPDLDPRRSE